MNEKLPTIAFSLEMPEEQIVEKSVSQASVCVHQILS
ncbi:hypothetical protein ACWWJF_27545 [Symbiopectobacterium sp. Eva_TO]